MGNNRERAVAYFNRGFEYGNNGDYDLAIADYTEAIIGSTRT